jgi:hypothetical protein
VIPGFREAFNANYRPENYDSLLAATEAQTGTRVEFRVAETPIFLPEALLDSIALAGSQLAQQLLSWPEYLEAAQKSIPAGYRVAGNSAHPNFLTADFALVRNQDGGLAPKLVEMQAFPSVYAYQVMLGHAYRNVFKLSDSLHMFLGGLDEESFWKLFRQTVLGSHPPENVVLTEVDPFHQKTLPDFLLTSAALGIAIVDIASLVPIGDKLHYRNGQGNLVPIHRIYNRAIADEMMARKVELPFSLEHPWDVEWAGHPNWYFLISKYSIPWLSNPPAHANPDNIGPAHTNAARAVVPPAVFLSDFLSGKGEAWLRASGVPLPDSSDPRRVYDQLLLKPLFSFAGKGIQFDPSHADLLAIPNEQRGDYLLQQRMYFVPTIETPHGLTQAEIRILYLWPDGGKIAPALSLVRLGRGKMMGVDHNRNQEWVGASAAFWQ